MCFIKEPFKLDFKIATRDVVCYKVVRYKKGNKYFYSYYKNFRYTKNKLYQIDIEKSISWTSYSIRIHKGFHSYTSLKKANINFGNFYNNAIIVKCIIPKGSKYFRNGYKREFVSNKIKIISIKKYLL